MTGKARGRADRRNCVEYALFARSGFTAELRTLADDRDDLHLYAPSALTAALDSA